MDATINVFLTGLPIIWYGIFDWQYSKEELLTNYNLYKIGLKNKCLNGFLYWRWYIYATWQSIMLYWLSFETFNKSIGITYNIVNGQIEVIKVQTGSMRLCGVFIVETLCFLVNLKVFVSTYRHNFLTVLWTFGSIGVFYL